MHRLLFILACCLVAARGSWAQDFTIESPDKAEVWPKATLSDRVLHWSPEKKAFTAEVTFNTNRYTGDGTPGESESYEFVIPGISFDEHSQQFSVQAPSGEPVVVAQRTKLFIGYRIDLCRTATIHVAREKSEVSVRMAVTAHPAPDPAPEGGGNQHLPLDSLISH